MMATDYSEAELRFMERNTMRLPDPVPSLNTNPPARHPLAGRSHGVRSTSRQALKSVNLTKDQNQVLVALTMHDHAMCDRELLHYLRLNSDKGAKWDINQVSGRRNDLYKKHQKVDQAGSWKCQHSSGRAIHWKVVSGGQA